MAPTSKRVKTSHGTLSPNNNNDDRSSTQTVIVKVEMLRNPASSGQVKALILDANNQPNMKQLGTINATLVPRNKSFHKKCDHTSSDLQAIGCAMFDSNGAPRCREILGMPSRNKKPFLYISEFQLDDDLNLVSTDIGADALKQFMGFVEGKWSVAAYIGDDREGMTKEEREELNRLRSSRKGNRKSLEEVQLTRKAVALDVRKFIRNGFRELSEETTLETGRVYATLDMWTSWNNAQDQSNEMTHADAMEVMLRGDEPLDPQKYAITEKDEELIKLLISEGNILSGNGYMSFSSYNNQKQSATVSSIMEQADKLIADGADYNRSNALHACAANGISALLDPLVNRGALIDATDRYNVTPLMCAAQMAPGSVTTQNFTPSSNVIRALLALGADRNVRDRAGKTALGHFYASARDNADYGKCFGLHIGSDGVDPIIEGLLMPTDGATGADLRCK